MREAPTEGPPEPDRQVADERGGLPEGLPWTLEIRPLERGVPDERADVQATVPLFERIQTRHRAYIDYVAGAGQPEGQQRQQALTTSQELRILSGLAQQREGFLHRVGGGIRERGGLHSASRLPAWKLKAA